MRLGGGFIRSSSLFLSGWANRDIRWITESTDPVSDGDKSDAPTAIQSVRQPRPVGTRPAVAFLVSDGVD